MTQPIARPIHICSIADRRISTLGWSAPQDLTLGLGSPPPDGMDSMVPLFNTADFDRERVLYTLQTPQAARDICAAPFFYATQIDNAAAVISVPFERLGDIDAPHPALAPRYIFSLGRTGSTLLVRLLAALDVPCVSEPDIFTQICRLEPAQRLLLGPEMEQHLLRASLASLARFVGPAPYIKLRSQCNIRPEALTSPVPGCRAILMLRNQTDWALSRRRAFGETPIMIAHFLRDGLQAFDRLTQAGAAPLIVWFEDLVRAPLRALKPILQGVERGGETARVRIAEIMATDAQAGTPLARSAIAAQPQEGDFLRAFEREWAALRERADFGAEALALMGEVSARRDGRVF